MSMCMLVGFTPTTAFATSLTSCTGSDSCNHEASITSGETTTHYSTLAEAISAETDGQTVQLLKNVKLEETLKMGNKAITIDLAGHDITATDTRAIHVTSGALTITGSGVITSNKKDSSDALKDKSVIRAGSDAQTETTAVSLEIGSDVTIQSDKCYGVTAFGYNDATVTIGGIVAVTGDNAAVAGNGKKEFGSTTTITINGKVSSTNGVAIYQPQRGTLDINGTVEGGIEAKSGTVNINENSIVSSVSGTAITPSHEANSDDPSTKGYAIAAVENKAYPNGAGTFHVNGGTISGKIAIENDNGENNSVTKAAINIKGGTFSNFDALGFLTEDANVTIDLRDDVTIQDDKKGNTEGILTVDKGTVTVDGNGKTVKVNQTTEDSKKASALNVTTNSKVTLKNLTIDGGGEAKHGVNVFGGSTTLENVTLKNFTGYGMVVQGTATASGLTVTNCGWGGVNVDAKSYEGNSGFRLNSGNVKSVVVENSSKGSKTVTAEITGGTVSGAYIVSNGAIQTKLDNTTLRITGGTFGSDPTAYLAEGYIAKRSGSENAYTYEVIAKSNLKSGVYTTDPSGALASYYYISSTANNVWTVSYAGGGSSSTTTDSVTNNTANDASGTSSADGTTQVATTTATVKAETKTEENGKTTTTATVDSATADKIVEKAVENKSEEVVVNTATASTVAETAAGTTTTVDLPEKAIKAIAEQTSAAVTIKSDAAEIKMDAGAVKAVAEQAGEEGTVNLVVETVAQNENKVEVDLKLVTSKGNVSNFKGGSVSVTVKLNDALAAKPVVCVYIDDHGTYHKVKGVKNTDGTFTFETGHFSTYAVMAEEEADQVIAEQTNSVKNMVDELSLKAKTKKNAKGNIKVTLKVDSEAIKAIEDLGYTVTYKFSRSTRAAKGYKAVLGKAGKTYTDKTGKAGKTYYYKARVMIYDAQGNLIAKSALKQCTSKAITK